MVIFLICFLLLQGCGVLFYREEDERKRQEAEYRPYQQQNTIEAYQEFIKKYPDNLFVSEAKCSIEHLEFAPYEQKDTIEGYRDFMKSYPLTAIFHELLRKLISWNSSKLKTLIPSQHTVSFFDQKPRSNYIMLAQQRLQDLEFQRPGHHMPDDSSSLTCCFTGSM